MKVAVTGATGLIGTALTTELRARGDDVITVGRGAGATVRWDPAAGTIDADALEGLDAVVHLAGEPIGEKRWTDDEKRAIHDSRSRGTGLLATTLAGLARPPAVLVSGSAVGYYGNRGDEVLTETSGPGPAADFLVGVCLAWEAATAPAEAAGIRTVHVRTGIVLSADGGALARMLTPFKLGLGGRIGSGRQYMSWISIDDEVGAMLHALDHDTVVGAVNATGPAPVTNAQFTKALGTALHRPTILPTPLAPLKLVYGGELVQHLLVDGQRVMPARLAETGYDFRHPTLAAALAAVTGG
ncbi:MAG: TIGR01777 family oxidoreductase [Acidimicrobiia bacterium]